MIPVSLFGAFGERNNQLGQFNIQLTFSEFIHEHFYSTQELDCREIKKESLKLVGVSLMHNFVALLQLVANWISVSITKALYTLYLSRTRLCQMFKTVASNQLKSTGHQDGEPFWNILYQVNKSIQALFKHILSSISRGLAPQVCRFLMHKAVDFSIDGRRQFFSLKIECILSI